MVCQFICLNQNSEKDMLLFVVLKQNSDESNVSIKALGSPFVLIDWQSNESTPHHKICSRRRFILEEAQRGSDKSGAKETPDYPV